MTVEIAKIQNETLRHAAEVADLNDNTANSGKLDQKELSVFIREAVKTDCNMAEIKEVCNQVGVEHATDDIKASMEKLNQLQKLEKELQYQNNILKKRKNEIKNLEQQDDNRRSKNGWITFGSMAGGVVSGAIAGAAVGSAFAGVGAMPGAFIGGFVGMIGGLGLGSKFLDSESNYTERREYKEQARPIKNKVNELKKQMQEIEYSL